MYNNDLTEAMVRQTNKMVMKMEIKRFDFDTEFGFAWIVVDIGAISYFMH